MSNTKDSKIRNNVLIAYTGEDETVEIPYGITKIGKNAFSCSAVKNVIMPDTVVAIGEGAFDESFITVIDIPNSVTEIGNDAFNLCEDLKTVRLSENVKTIGEGAFCWTDIETITLPAGLKKISAHMFSYSSLQSIVLPEGVTSIGDDAFSGCSKLKSVNIPDSVKTIGEHAFCGCKKLADKDGLIIVRDTLYGYTGNKQNVVIPDHVSLLDFDTLYDVKTDTDFILRGVTLSVRNGSFMPLAKEDAAKAGDIYQYLNDDLLQECILNKKAWKYLNPETQARILLSRYCIECVQKKQAEAIAECMARIIPEIKDKNDLDAVPGFLKKFQNDLTDQTVADIYQALTKHRSGKKTVEEIEKNSGLRAKVSRILKPDAKLSEAGSLIMKWLDENGRQESDIASELKNNCNLEVSSLPVIKDKEGNALEPFVLGWLMNHHDMTDPETRYSRPLYDKPGIDEQAKQIVDLLDQESFHDALKSISREYLGLSGYDRKLFTVYPICRYANEELMTALARIAPYWKSGRSGIDAPALKTFRDALRYSNTRAAMLFADKMNELNLYAELRGMSEEYLRDEVLSDVGLSKEGTKQYDLGNQTVTVRLQQDFSFLVEIPDTGKTMKSIPKKGADPDKYKGANADLSQLKKDVKRVARNHKAILFADYLNGTEKDIDSWKKNNFDNPVFNIMAASVVWDQGGNTFILMGERGLDSSGHTYSLTAEPVKVAHPIEMKAEDIRRWQSYFAKEHHKQLFHQVWEPVRYPNMITKDRYNGAELPLFMFTGKDKDGIHTFGYHAYSDHFGFTLDDCSLTYKASTWRLDWGYSDSTNYYTLGDFTFERFTRKVNHIVTILDRMTVYSLIRNNVTDVKDLLPSYTYAQILEFIEAAQESKAADVLALLLDYKEENYPEMDPLEEFDFEM